MYYWDLDNIHFENIKNGKKIYEIRIYDKKRRNIKINDFIELNKRDTNETIYVKVIDISLFNNFYDAIKEVSIKKVLPNLKTIKEAVNLYESILDYKINSLKYGIVRFKFELINF